MSTTVELATAPKESEAKGQSSTFAQPRQEETIELDGSFLGRAFGGAPGEQPSDGTIRVLRSPTLSHPANTGLHAISLKSAQQTHGNRFTQRAVAQIQRKPMPARLLQRQCSCGGTCAACQGKVAEEEEPKFLQRQTAQADAPGNVVDAAVVPSNSAGQPLDKETRNFMEPRFRSDFSDVRVHTDSSAAHSAEMLHADAYATGRDIYFAAGKYAPETTSGQRLLAHELVHTIQQGENARSPFSRSFANGNVPVGRNDDALEDQANRIADAVVIHDSCVVVPSESEATPVDSATKGPLIQQEQAVPGRVNRANDRQGDHLQVSTHAAKSVQRFSAYEHIALGDESKGGPNSLIVLDCHDKDFRERGHTAKWPSKWTMLLAGATRQQIRAVTQGLTYGEVVALSGDFYDTFEALNEAPLTEIFDLIPLIHSPTATTTELEIATGGRYLDLAEKNVSHFSNVPEGQRNIDVWRKMHSNAIQTARLSGGNESMINKAWAENAAGDHYLTDAFAAGHLRQQRAKLIKENEQLPSVLLHNLENKFGVLVTNKRGDKPWVAYGDDSLATKGMPVHYLKVKEAVELSKMDLRDALDAGKAYKVPTIFPAEGLVPFPASSAINWTLDDADEEMMRLTVTEGPGIAKGKWADDNRVIDWIKKAGPEALKRQSMLDKLRMVDALMSVYVDESDCWAVRQICESTTSDLERQYIQVDYDLSPCFKPANRPEWIMVGNRGRK